MVFFNPCLKVKINQNVTFNYQFEEEDNLTKAANANCYYYLFGFYVLCIYNKGVLIGTFTI